ncbi:hypothetical protein M758_UG286300 [Ceratodon purpureus]|nr:hypothetical protein M758_UG286300 [Ceratodon purpureus]
MFVTVYDMHGMSEQPGDGCSGMGAPHKFQYPRDATSIWNRRNHRHLCNSCSCMYCTALRWIVLPHCKCKLPRLSYGLLLEARVRAKRRRCPHLPRHKLTKASKCECVASGRDQWTWKLVFGECDLQEGNPTGELLEDDKFISDRSTDESGIVILG